MKEVDEKANNLLQTERINLMYRINMVRTWVQLKIREFNSCSRRVIETLDDWIVVAVESENNSV